ncbi:MAG: ABC transporter permease subunit [Acidimicrobiia bacterium]|nr:ABC transporter permease subunit [Acidimicrobiia bacterium]
MGISIPASCWSRGPRAIMSTVKRQPTGTDRATSTRVESVLERRRSGRWRSALASAVNTPRELARDRFALAGMIVLVLFAIVAVIGPYIAPYGPFEATFAADGSLFRLESPTATNLLGTNYSGYDVLSQLLVGARIALLVGLTAAIAVGGISTILGIVAGYFGGRTDNAIMRLTDLALSIPTLPVAIVFVGLAGPSLRNILIIIIALYWRNGARIIRSAALTAKEQVYVSASRAAGASPLYIMFVHILPTVLPVAFLWMTMSVAFAILAEASLSFIGLGDPRVVSWGQMLNLAFSTGTIRTAWWWVIPPSLALVVVITSIYFVGRAYEERTNPRLRKRSG